MIFIEALLKNYVSFRKTNQSWYQIFSIFVASLGAFSCGAQFTWTSPSIPILISNSSHIEVMTLDEGSYFTIIQAATAILVVPFLSRLIDIIGRKKMLILLSIPHIAAWLLIILAQNCYMLYASRAAAGIADAILFCTVSVYVGEVSTPRVRGTWGNLYAVLLFFGQFMINLVGTYCSIRATASIFCCVPITCLVLSLIIPESPYYLIMKGKEKDARDVLRVLRWSDNVDEEFGVLLKDVNRQISESKTYKDLFIITANRKALLISIANRVCQQLSGYSAFSVYTQYMFNQAGGSISDSLSSIIYTAVLMISVTVFSIFVDKLGRKVLMTFSNFTCGIVLAIEATYFYIDTETTVDLSNLKWLPVTGMLSYILLYSSGLAIVPTLMMGELFSTSIKSKAMCILHICTSIFVLSVTKLFQVLTINFGMYVPFYLFSICCFLSTIYSYVCIPETKGKTLEEIQQDLRGTKS